MNIAQAGLSVAAVSTIIFICLLIALIAYVILALLLSRIFKKTGIDQWIAWVPVYNTWKLLELGDQKGYWAILMILPFISYVALVFYYIALYRIGLKFGKESWFVVIGIFIPLIWFGWLALDDSKWHPKALK
jgi:hypothetical protein